MYVCWGGGIEDKAAGLIREYRHAYYVISCNNLLAVIKVGKFYLWWWWWRGEGRGAW